MPTETGHTRAIRASRVTGTSVYNKEGSSIGTVEDIILDKTSNKIMFAVLGFGGFLGLGEKYHPVPWSLLNYDEDKGGYVVPMTKDILKSAPTYDISDLTKHDGEIRDKSYSYYKVDQDW
ncbi:MAG: PRC-barrel domain-containing protein [Alphaproteobacteria bacterium]|jgi:sporulation protein YlmC with PRC-barrel domain|nr:PRC-barrel domain-containing protein [Alphaproteobacteria bacterium]